MRNTLLLLVVGFFSMPALAQCHFVAEPVANTVWYRREGWSLPGVQDGRAFVRINFKTADGKQRSLNWPDGVTVSGLPSNQGFSATFPEATFEENGTKMRMPQRKVGVHWLWRWEINGMPYAYTYDLEPYDVGCSFTIDLVDDKGDGVFRTMVTAGHSPMTLTPQPPPLPTWAVKPQS